MNIKKLERDDFDITVKDKNGSDQPYLDVKVN